MIGHLAASCADQKSRPRCPPSWWARVSPEHYSVQKPSVVDVSPEAMVTKVVDASFPMVAMEVRAPPTVVLLPEVAEDHKSFGLAPSGPTPISGDSPVGGLPSSPGMLGGGLVPDHVLDFPPGSARGQLDSGSFGESDSGDWAAEAAKVEDGWTAVKGKKSRPSSHPSQMNLRSSKKGSKSKGKT